MNRDKDVSNSARDSSVGNEDNGSEHTSLNTILKSSADRNMFVKDTADEG